MNNRREDTSEKKFTCFSETRQDASLFCCCIFTKEKLIHGNENSLEKVALLKQEYYVLLRVFVVHLV